MNINFYTYFYVIVNKEHSDVNFYYHNYTVPYIRHQHIVENTKILLPG